MSNALTSIALFRSNLRISKRLGTSRMSSDAALHKSSCQLPATLLLRAVLCKVSLSLCSIAPPIQTTTIPFLHLVCNSRPEHAMPSNGCVLILDTLHRSSISAGRHGCFETHCPCHHCNLGTRKPMPPCACRSYPWASASSARPRRPPFH